VVEVGEKLKSFVCYGKAAEFTFGSSTYINKDPIAGKTDTECITSLCHSQAYPETSVSCVRVCVFYKGKESRSTSFFFSVALVDMDESGRSWDKTHLSNPVIAATGGHPTSSSSARSSARSLSNKSYDGSEFQEDTQTKRYNNAGLKSRNGSDNYGVGYIDETEYENSQEVKEAPEHEEVCVKVMSHNFGKAKEQIINTNGNPGQQKQSLEAAYMSRRGDELASYEEKGNRNGKHKGDQNQNEEVEEGDWLHLCSEREHKANMKVLTEFDFSVWDYTQQELVAMAWSIFYDADLIEEFQIPAQRFNNFVLAIFATSHKVPYHNYYHYFSVLHTSWLFLRKNPTIMTNLTKTDLLGCFTGAIGHDADHPGLTNSFLCVTKHELSVRYNDLSVLENHHCATTYTILQREECNIFCNLSDSDWKVTRNVIVSAILNTDMARHFNLVSNFIKMFKDKTVEEFKGNRNMRNQIISMVVHCADISNPVKPWFICKRFADSVSEEFRAQVEQEKLHKVPCTPHMLGLDKKGQAKMELGFIDVFTWPAIDALNCVLPNLTECFANMEQNREFWQDIMESYKTKLGSWKN